jgi:GTP diphosphokinase / guanosine-3',5'-bis(diphosphate) 3'-diphosphatase
MNDGYTHDKRRKNNMPNQAKNIALMIKALAFSAGKHRDQRQDDAAASPYINHPIALANLLIEVGVTDNKVICAALLHDTLEDTATTYAELKAHFGKKISDTVLAVSDDKSLSDAERRRIQIAHAKTANKRAKLVKLADKTCNLRDIIHSPPVGWNMKRKRDYFDWAKAVVDEMRGVNKKLEKAFDKAYALKP